MPNAVLSDNEYETYISLDVFQMTVTPIKECPWRLGVYPSFKFVYDRETKKRQVSFLLHNGETVLSDLNFDATEFIDAIFLQLRWIKKRDYSGSNSVVLAQEIVNHFNITVEIDITKCVSITLGAQCMTHLWPRIQSVHYIDKNVISEPFFRKFFPAD